jgi:hypothetical protein
MNNSTILDEILDSQRSPNDKSGLGYNKEVAHFEANTYKKHEVTLHFQKVEAKMQVKNLHKARKLS